MKHFKNLILLILVVNTFAFGNGSSEDVVSDPEKKHIVFLVSVDVNNYEADRTVPQFAKMLEEKMGYETTVLIGEGERQGYEFSNLEIILKADLLVVFCRRLALPINQMTMIKHYLELGKPIMGIRTANHAFHILKDNVKENHTDWKNFVPMILGSLNKGYGPVGPGIDVSVEPTATSHEIVRNLGSNKWHSSGNLYLVELVDFEAEVILSGKSNELEMPIAWVRNTPGNGRMFYTSLGHPSDFDMPIFVDLLSNGVKWCIGGE